MKFSNSTRRFWRFDVSSCPQKQAKIATFLPQIRCFDSLLRSMCFACHTSSASYDFNIYSRCPYPRYGASNFVRFSARLRNSICKQNWRFILQVVINDGLLLCLLSHFFQKRFLIRQTEVRIIFSNFAPRNLLSNCYEKTIIPSCFDVLPYGWCAEKSYRFQDYVC